MSLLMVRVSSVMLAALIIIIAISLSKQSIVVGISS